MKNQSEAPKQITYDQAKLVANRVCVSMALTQAGIDAYWAGWPNFRKLVIRTTFKRLELAKKIVSEAGFERKRWPRPSRWAKKPGACHFTVIVRIPEYSLFELHPAPVKPSEPLEERRSDLDEELLSILNQSRAFDDDDDHDDDEEPSE